TASASEPRTPVVRRLPIRSRAGSNEHSRPTWGSAPTPSPRPSSPTAPTSPHAACWTTHPLDLHPSSHDALSPTSRRSSPVPRARGAVVETEDDPVPSPSSPRSPSPETPYAWAVDRLD